MVNHFQVDKIQCSIHRTKLILNIPKTELSYKDTLVLIIINIKCFGIQMKKKQIEEENYSICSQ